MLLIMKGERVMNFMVIHLKVVEIFRVSQDQSGGVTDLRDAHTSKSSLLCS